MIEMYGHRFTSAYGEVPNDTWSRAMAHLTGRQIADGLQACFKRESNWPPTLPELIDLCDPPNRNSLPEFKGLPKPRADKKVAEKHIREMRKKL